MFNKKLPLKWQFFNFVAFLEKNSYTDDTVNILALKPKSACGAFFYELAG